MKSNTTIVKGLLIIIIVAIVILLLLRVYIPEYLLLLEVAALSALYFLTAYEATKNQLTQKAKTNIRIGLFFVFLGIFMLFLLFII
jgi:hypothetical protein